MSMPVNCESNAKIFAQIKLYPIEEDEVFKKVEDFVKSDKYHYQISINASKVVHAQKDIKLLQSINSADIINADGMPIKIITQYLCKRYTKRMGGFDYIDRLARRHPEYNYYFFGAKQEIVEKVVKYYIENYNLNIVGWRNGYFKANELNAIIDEINQKKTDILYIALGTPTKEYMLYDYRYSLKCKLAVGVGGAFDIIAGKHKRAPLWIQNIGMEWFFRLMQDPKRLWKRYLITNTKFIFLLLKEFFKHNP